MKRPLHKVPKPKPHPFELTFEETLTLRLHRTKGMSLTAIARELGVHRGSAQRFLKAAEAKIATYRKLAAEQNKEVVAERLIAELYRLPRQRSD